MLKDSSIAKYLKSSTTSQPQKQNLQSQLESMLQQSQPITISNQKSYYHTGDFVNFTLNTNNHKGYLTILFADSNSFTVLYPNPRASSRSIQGQQSFPRDFGNFKVRAFKNCNGCQQDKTSIYLLLTSQPLANIAKMTQDKLLNFARGSDVAKIISKDVDLVFDEPVQNRTNSGLIMGKHEFFVD